MDLLKNNYLSFKNGDEKQIFWNFKGEFDFVDDWFLMSTPFPLIIISLSYLYFVVKLGPETMKNRTPYALTNIMTIYNIIQVMLSTSMLFLTLQLVIPNGLIYPTCFQETKESRYMMTAAMHNYFCCKLTELLDTVFFVLRKKQSQVTFLHVYHHFFILWCSWLMLKYEPIYTVIFLGVVNSFVHVIMYLYYCLSTFPSMTKYLWWKKYITKLQLIQFTMVLIHFLVTHITSQCKPSYALISVMWSNSFLFIYLFAKFYIDAYKNKKNKLGCNNK